MTGKPYTPRGFRGVWAAFKRTAGVDDFQFHDIRARSLTDADATGLDLQALAGHADHKTTEAYITEGNRRWRRRMRSDRRTLVE